MNPAGDSSRRPYPTGPDEIDKSFKRLLEGLRTTLPGAQVLLGFLLILPFQSRFEDLSSFSRFLYLVAFFSAALASVLLIAPSVHQRFRAPITGIRRNDGSHVAAAVWVSLAGSVFLGIAVVAATALVGSVVDVGLEVTFGWVAIAVAVLYTWAVQPLVQFRDRDRDEDAAREHEHQGG